MASKARFAFDVIVDEFDRHREQSEPLDTTAVRPSITPRPHWEPFRFTHDHRLGSFGLRDNFSAGSLGRAIRIQVEVDFILRQFSQ